MASRRYGSAKKHGGVPVDGGGWSGARARWENDVLTPYEKVGAVLTAGQLLRISTAALLAFFHTSTTPHTEAADTVANRNKAFTVPNRPNDDSYYINAPPATFFHLVEQGTATAPILRAANETRYIYAKLALANR
jgi:hypothetical protein